MDTEADLVKYPRIIPIKLLVGKEVLRCIVRCPHCGEKHYHGLGEIKGPVMWGHRGGDCGLGGYYIVSK